MVDLFEKEQLRKDIKEKKKERKFEPCYHGPPPVPKT
jgi:hypothetical protein